MNKFIFFFLALLGLVHPVFALKTRLSLQNEWGFYRSDNPWETDKFRLLCRFDALFHAFYRDDPNDYQGKIRITPVQYGFNSADRLITYQISGNVSRRLKEDRTIFVSLSRQGQFFHYGNLKINAAINQAQGDYYYNGEKFQQLVHGQYAYRSIDNANPNTLDIISIQYTLFHRFNQFTLGGGVSAERFQIQFLSKKNKGWRPGLHLNVGYSGAFEFRFDYNGLYHESLITSFPSYEQNFKVLAGILLGNKWSVFAYADFYFRHFTRSSSIDDLFYSPLDSENFIYIKTDCELTPILAVYGKAGYFRDKLGADAKAIGGFQALLGLRLQSH